jgi:hypothetical protein
MDTLTFWDRVATYNETTWPLQAAMLVAALYLMYRLLAQPGPKTDRWMKAFFTFAFSWNGIVLFLVFLRNPVSMITGTPLFVIVAILFALDIFAGKTQFRLPHGKWARGFTVVWVLLALLYPLIGWPLGHIYPKVLFPVFPCPLTVFAIALVAAAAPKVDRRVFVALLPWALMGLPKCLGALDCYEDCILFASGVYGLVVLIAKWRSMDMVSRIG